MSKQKIPVMNSITVGGDPVGELSVSDDVADYLTKMLAGRVKIQLRAIIDLGSAGPRIVAVSFHESPAPPSLIFQMIDQTPSDTASQGDG